MVSGGSQDGGWTKAPPGAGAREPARPTLRRPADGEQPRTTEWPVDLRICRRVISVTYCGASRPPFDQVAQSRFQSPQPSETGTVWPVPVFTQVTGSPIWDQL